MSNNALAAFGDQPPRQLATSEAMQSREAHEVQAAMVVAKKFPRDTIQAQIRILQACQRVGLAEASMYAYPKGGSRVEGPTIRLAEVLAQCWGNIDFGIKELEQRHGESTVMAYAWDLETNARQTKVFTVKHERKVNQKDSSGKSIGHRIDVLDDPRDIYEMVANSGARRLRACILGVIPGDIQDAAIAQCHKTLAGDSKEPLIDKVRKMVAAFAEIGVTQEMIEERLGHKMEATSANEIVNLRSIYQSIKDGMSDRTAWFDLTDGTEEAGDAGPADANALRSSPRKRGRPKKDDLPPPPAEPTGEEARAEMSGFFGGDAPQAGPSDTDPASPEDINRVKIFANLKLDEAKAEQNDFNRKKVIGFACIGMFAGGSVPTELTHKEAVAIAAEVKKLTVADAQEALS